MKKPYTVTYQASEYDSPRFRRAESQETWMARGILSFFGLIAFVVLVSVATANNDFVIPMKAHKALEFGGELNSSLGDFNGMLTISKDAYKNERARALMRMAQEKGFTRDQQLYLVAQINRENGAWHEETRGDGGCSVGLIQWNECARGKLNYRDWEHQLEIFIEEVSTKYEKQRKYHNDEKAFDLARVSWNKPAVLRSGAYKTVYYYDVERTYNTLFN